MRITGTVRYQDFEGGFWGIVTDDQQYLRPTNDLPAEFQRDGCRITARAEPSNEISFHMWGRNVRVRDVQGESAEVD